MAHPLTIFRVMLRGCRLLLVAGCRRRFCKGSFSAKFQSLVLVQSSKKLNQFRHEPGPSGLVAGSQTCAVVAMEVLVEQRR